MVHKICAASNWSVVKSAISIAFDTAKLVLRQAIVSATSKQEKQDKNLVSGAQFWPCKFHIALLTLRGSTIKWRCKREEERISFMHF